MLKKRRIVAIFLATALAAACNFPNPPEPVTPTGPSPFDGCGGQGAACGPGKPLCCPGGVCAGGKCGTRCVGVGGNCNTSADCCGVSTCKNHQCDLGACLPFNSHCQASADCCDVLTCQSGLCK